MNLLFDGSQLMKLFGDLLKKHNQYFWISPYANSNFPFIFELAEKDVSTSKICVGLRDFETSPTFINEFYDFDYVRYFDANTLKYSNGLFLFYTNDQNWDFLHGSLRLDKQCFEINSGVVSHINHLDVDAFLVLSEVIRINEYFWINSKKFTDESYETYWDAWNKIQKNQGNIKLPKS